MSFASSLLLSWAKVQPAAVARSTTCLSGRMVSHSRRLVLGVATPSQHRCVHTTVRIIVTQDVSDGKLYTGDIASVSAGYARNFLIPKKKAVYATRQNFARLQIKDPDLETVDERRLRLEREALAGDDKDLKAADLLKVYLRNKVLKIWRNVDTSGTDYNAISPGIVDAKVVRRKLSKQLKIDLDPYEKVHVFKEPVNHTELPARQLDTYVNEMGDRNTPCTTQIKHLGEYIARISLQGGYNIPLKIEVLKR